MAAGVRRRYEADLGVGITGVAGPDSSEHKPAGLVFVSVVGPAWARGVRLDEDRGRELNRAHAVQAALRLCRVVVRAMSGPYRQRLKPRDRLARRAVRGRPNFGLVTSAPREYSTNVRPTR